MKNDLTDRLMNFAVAIIKMSRKLDNSIENRIIKNQLIKAATSAGANYEESQGASSTPDFINKVKISLKEMRESNYWLNILGQTVNPSDRPSDLDDLIGESEQLKKILGAICRKKTGKINNNTL
ncbi:MAG: four helix bundle protein [Bacteroidales bacterium]|nr:four helix bundle protein [Bacteroidales bacterium]MBK9358150.1 four helix bundle protein [Bacteroidales bacterium]